MNSFPSSSCPSRLRGSIFLLLCAFCLPACGPGNYLNDNDRLRAEYLDLTAKVEKLDAELASTRKALEVEQQRTPPKLPAGVLRPVTAAVEIGSFSGGIDTNSDGIDNALRIYVKTCDAQNNFLPTVGSAKITAAYIPAGKPAVTVATADIDAQAFQAAYRGGVAGTHYTFVIPVTTAIPADVKELIVSVAVTDLVTGGKFETQKSVRWAGAAAK